MPVMNYRKGTGAETSWIIEETSFHEKYTGKCESIFTQGNGYLGLPQFAGRKICGYCQGYVHHRNIQQSKQRGSN